MARNNRSVVIAMEVARTLVQAQRSVLHGFESIDGTLVDADVLRSLRDAAYTVVDAVNETLIDDDDFLTDDGDAGTLGWGDAGAEL